MTNRPRVGAVLVNWNGGDLTISCIESLLAMTCGLWRIVVFDNASTDGSPDDVARRFPQVVMMRSPENLGFTGANNAGIRKLMDDGADYVWVLNNDTVVESTSLEELLGAATSHAGVAAVGAKILYADPPHAIWYGGARLNAVTYDAPHEGVGKPRAFGPQAPVEVDFVTGCSMLMPRHALAQVGVFDESFFAYAEDFDWCVRARKRGFRLIYAPQAVVYHKVSASVRRNTMGDSQGTGSPRVYYLATRNSLWVVRRHAKPWQVVTAVAARLVRVVYCSAGMILLRRWDKLFALWNGVRDGLRARIAEPA